MLNGGGAVRATRASWRLPREKKPNVHAVVAAAVCGCGSLAAFARRGEPRRVPRWTASRIRVQVRSERDRAAGSRRAKSRARAARPAGGHDERRVVHFMRDALAGVPLRGPDSVNRSFFFCAVPVRSEKPPFSTSDDTPAQSSRPSWGWLTRTRGRTVLTIGRDAPLLPTWLVCPTSSREDDKARGDEAFYNARRVSRPTSLSAAASARTFDAGAVLKGCGRTGPRRRRSRSVCSTSSTRNNGRWTSASRSLRARCDVAHERART